MKRQTTWADRLKADPKGRLNLEAKLKVEIYENEKCSGT